LLAQKITALYLRHFIIDTTLARVKSLNSGEYL